MDDERKDACRHRRSEQAVGHPSEVASPPGTIVRPLKRSAASSASGLPRPRRRHRRRLYLPAGRPVARGPAADK